MPYPKNSKEAAEMVKEKAEKAGQSLNAYCLARAIHPSLIYNWENRPPGGFDGVTFAKLMEPIAKK